MDNLKIKIVCGFREDQTYTVESEEAHKAYYLFLNPDRRGIFNNGLGIIGRDIQRIEPDYIATMGWNKNHRLETDDWNEINKLGIERKFRDMLNKAKDVAYLIQKKPDLLAHKLSTILLAQEEGKKLLI